MRVTSTYAAETQPSELYYTEVAGTTHRTFHFFSN